MKKVEINVVKDILKSSMALHEFGKPVFNIIGNEIAKVVSPTLFLINLRGADPLDYEFVNIAFSDIIHQNKGNKDIFLAFKADKWEIEELLTGITKILKLKKQTDKTDEQTLKDADVHLILINGSNETVYITNLSNKHLEVLQEIEIRSKMSSAEIQANFKMIAEDTMGILTDLINSKFIYKEDEQYYNSINSLI